MEFATLQSLHKTILSALKISADTAGLPCSRAQELGSDFLTKNTMLSLTIWHIINPQNIQGFPITSDSFKVYDFPSAHVLIRTLFEGYINMNYVLIDPKSDEEREFRLNLWDRHALLERQKMASSIGSQHKKVKRGERRIDVYAESIKNSQYFRTLPGDEQQSFLNMHKWTKLNTIQRADKANIHRSQSEFIYKFLSNYAHSEAFALMQIHSVFSVQMAQKLMRFPIRFTEMFLNLTLKLFAKLHPVATSIIESDQDLLEIIDLWEDLKRKDLKEVSRIGI